MITRRRAREVVLQLLYQHDVNPDQDVEVSKQFLTSRLKSEPSIVSFAIGLLTNILSKRKQIDDAISARATNWNIRRMAFIDRNILRLGAYEILMTDVPGQVAINEAIELAKRYGDRNSGGFVNGVLDRILQDSNSANNSVDSKEQAKEEQLQAT